MRRNKIILGRFISVLTGVLMLIIIPLEFNLWSEAEMINKYTEKAIEEFADNVRQNGILTKEAYESLLNTISRSQKRYIVEPLIGRAVENISETEGVSEYMDIMYTDEILVQLYNAGSIELKDKDVFSITIQAEKRTEK